MAPESFLAYFLAYKVINEQFHGEKSRILTTNDYRLQNCLIFVNIPVQDVLVEVEVFVHIQILQHNYNVLIKYV